MKIKHYILLILWLCCIINLSAQIQTTELLGIDFHSSKVKDGEIDGNHKSINGFVNFPIHRSNSNFLGGRASYNYQKYSGISKQLDHELTGASINLFWKKKLNEKSSLTVFTDVGAYSDFKDINGEDFRFKLASMYITRHSNTLSSGFGLAYAKQFTAHQISPFAYIDYQINDRWQLSGLLPIKPKLTYKISDNLNWTNEISAGVETYRLSEKTWNSSVIELSGWYGLSAINLTMAKYHRFTLGVGYSVKQQMKFYENVNPNNVKLFTIDITNKNKPTSTIDIKGLRWSIGYNLVF